MSNAKAKILIVEDEEELADVFSLKLKAEGYDVSVATDGAEGVKAVKENKPDLVLLDLVMPNFDGYEALGKIKKDKSIKNTKVCVWSNLTQKAEIEKANSLGADCYLIKI